MISQLLTKLIKPEFNVTGGAGYEYAGQKGKTETVELYEISTPERQLVQLTAHYLLSYADRLFLVEKPADGKWRSQDAIEAVPRALAFLNLPGHNEANLFGVPETKIIPTAAEFEGGKIDQIYLRLNGKDGGEAPKYPDRIGAKPQELLAECRTYWKWFDENFSATKAMIAVEEASKEFGASNGSTTACRLPPRAIRFTCMCAPRGSSTPASSHIISSRGALSTASA